MDDFKFRPGDRVQFCEPVPPFIGQIGTVIECRISVAGFSYLVDTDMGEVVAREHWLVAAPPAKAR